MARPPRPWYWKERGGWYVTINKIRHKLAEGAKVKTKAEADTAFYTLMAGDKMPAPARETPPRGAAHGSIPAKPATTSADVVAGFLASRRAEGCKPKTVEWYRGFLDGFARLHPDPASLRPLDAKQWLAGHPTWGEASRRQAMACVKVCWKWAADEGLVPADPFRKLTLPDMPARKVVLTGAQLDAAIAATPDREFRDFLTAIRATGARPGSIAAFEARFIDWDQSMATLPDHKTRKRTNKPLEIHLNPDAAALCRELAIRHPVGPIFLNTDGKPWALNAWRSRFRRLRAAGLDLPPGGGAYSGRHEFATDALVAGTPMAIVSKLLGHTTIEMTEKHYNGVGGRHADLKASLSRFRPAKAAPDARSGDPPPKPPADDPPPAAP